MFFRMAGQAIARWLSPWLAPVRAQWRRLPPRLRLLTLPLLGLYLGLVGGLLGLGLWLGDEAMTLCIFTPILLVRLAYKLIWKRSVLNYERRSAGLIILVPAVFLPLYSSFNWLIYRNTRIAEVQSVADILRHPNYDYYHLRQAQVLRDSSVVYVGDEARWGKYHFLVAAPLVDDSLALTPLSPVPCWLFNKETTVSKFSSSPADSALLNHAVRYADSLRYAQNKGQLPLNRYDSLLQHQLAPLWASRRTELIDQPQSLHEVYLGPAASNYAEMLQRYLHSFASRGEVRLFSQTVSPAADAQDSLMLVEGWLAGGTLAVLLLSAMVELAPLPDEN
jgi:hypothetical protein